MIDTFFAIAHAMQTHHSSIWKDRALAEIVCALAFVSHSIHKSNTQDKDLKLCGKSIQDKGVLAMTLKGLPIFFLSVIEVFEGHLFASVNHYFILYSMTTNLISFSTEKFHGSITFLSKYGYIEINFIWFWFSIYKYHKRY